MYGLTHGYDIATSARLGSLAAGEVISHIGPRPHQDLKILAKGLLERP
jgi:fructokinase